MISNHIFKGLCINVVLATCEVLRREAPPVVAVLNKVEISKDKAEQLGCYMFGEYLHGAWRSVLDWSSK